MSRVPVGCPAGRTPTGRWPWLGARRAVGGEPFDDGHGRELAECLVEHDDVVPVGLVDARGDRVALGDRHSADKVAFWIGAAPETVRSVYAHMLEERGDLMTAHGENPMSVDSCSTSSSTNRARCSAGSHS